MLKKNDEIELTVDDCTALGSGVGKYQGMTVFAANTAPGDRALVHLIKVKPTYAVGKVVQILQPSPMRVAPACPVFSQCGGCTFGHLRYTDELRIKADQVRNNLQRIGGLESVPLPIRPSVQAERYRNKAQYPVRRGPQGEVQIGFYAPHSHRVINCADCLLQPASFAQIVAIFRAWIETYNVSIYDENNHRGMLRHLYLRAAAATGEIMVCAVINGRTLPHQDALLASLQASGLPIVSVIVNRNTADTNVVLGEENQVIFGQPYITDVLCGLRFRISPLSFYQVNHDTAEILYRQAMEYAGLTGSETVLDLYCGTGTIGLCMASAAKQVIGVEIVPQAIENAKENAKLNGIENARFLCADAAQAAATLREENVQPDVVVVDPPRKGCDEALLQTITQMAPARIVYVSCDSATLARDCKRLTALGYTLRSATPVDMFPRAPHVETVVLLSRK